MIYNNNNQDGWLTDAYNKVASTASKVYNKGNAYVNHDYSDLPYDQAFEKARGEGLVSFWWNGEEKNTDLVVNNKAKRILSYPNVNYVAHQDPKEDVDRHALAAKKEKVELDNTIAKKKHAFEEKKLALDERTYMQNKADEDDARREEQMQKAKDNYLSRFDEVAYVKGREIPGQLPMVTMYKKGNNGEFVKGSMMYHTPTMDSNIVPDEEVDSFVALFK